MSPILDAPEVEIKNLIRDEWDETIYDVGEQFVPSVHHGWVDSDGDYYEITVANPDESPVRGGETGYSGIDPTGAGPTQDIVGTVDVNCWADSTRSGVNGVTLNHRKAAFLMKAQVESILRDHAQGTDAAGNSTAFFHFSPMGASRNIEEDEEPPIWRWLVTAGYSYHAP